MKPALKYLVGAILVIDLGALALLTAVQQLRVVVVTEGGGSVSIDDGERRALSTVPAAGNLELKIENSGDRPVSVQPLRTAHKATLFDVRTYQPTGDFSPRGSLREGGVWNSAVRGSTLSWSGRVSDLTAAFRCAPDAGTACVSSSGVLVRCVELSTCSGKVEVTVESPRRYHHVLVPFWRGNVILSAPGHQVVSITQFLGSTQLFERAGSFKGETFDLGLPASQRWGAVLGMGWNGLALLLSVLGLLAIMIFLGAAITTPLVGRLGLLEALLLSFFVGEGLVGNLVTAVFYELTVGRSVALIGVSLAVVSLVQLAGFGGWRRWKECVQATGATEKSNLGVLALIAVASSLLYFFPALVFPGWFVGHGFTDTADYAAWASLAHDAPLDRSLGGVRFQDHVRLAISETLSGADAVGAMATHGLRLWVVWPFLAFALLRRLQLDAGTALLGAALAAHATALFETFSQGYLPQYEVAHFVIAGAWASAWFVEAEAEPARRWALLALGAVFACSVGLYPYQAFSVIAFGLVWLSLAVVRRSRAPLLSLVGVVLAVALITNVNLEVVFDFGKSTGQHRSFLNLLARHSVFPWYAAPEGRAILAGTDDFARNSLLADGFMEELFAASPDAGRAFVAPLALLTSAIPVLTWLVLALGLAAVLWVLRSRSPANWVMFWTLVFPICMTAALLSRGDIYFWVKTAMTLSALLVVPMAGLLASLVTSARTPLRMASALISLVLLTASLRTLWFDQLGYYVNRESAWLAQSRTHLMVYGDSLWHFQRFVSRLPAGQRFVFVGRLHDYFWTDNDFIIYNRLLTMLEGHETHHSGGETRRYSRSRESEYTGAQPLAAFDWAVQFDRCQALSAPSSVEFETELFCVRKLEGESAR